MAVKSEEKSLARELRRQGFSYNEILEHVSVSKGTLSLWLRDIALTDEQVARFLDKRCGGREKFILAMRQRRDNRWAEYQREAEEEYKLLSQDPSFMFGLALYVGEGSKTQQNELCITNCDPRVIQKGLQFFRQIGVPMDALRCGLHVHPGLSKKGAEQFWQEVTGLPPEQFHTTRDAISRASNGTKGHVQLYGTCQLRACSTRLRQKLQKWMELALR